MPKKPTLPVRAHGDAPSPETTEPQSIRISISEAGRLFGVNPRTIRRAIGAGEIRYIVTRGRYQLNFESILRWSQRHATVRHKRDGHGIGQWVDQWKISNPKYSPHAPEKK